MIKLKICVDIDNVLASSDEVMRRVIEDVSMSRVNLSYDDIKEFDYDLCIDSQGQAITKDEWHKVHSEFSEPRFLWQIRPIPGAVDHLNRLADRVEIHFATSRLPKAWRTTIEWLEYYHVPRHDLHFLRQGTKHASLGGFHFAVEDHYGQAVSFANAGVPCFLLSHPWNRQKPPHRGVTWVENWDELASNFEDESVRINS